MVIGRFIYYNSTPWRRIYFPLINRYAYLGGAHVEIAEQTGTEFSPLSPLFILLKDYLRMSEKPNSKRRYESGRQNLTAFNAEACSKRF